MLPFSWLHSPKSSYLELRSLTGMEFNVNIPEESFSVFQMERDDVPGVVVVNTALRKFEPKAVFGWHLSLSMALEQVVEKGLPVPDERKVADAFFETLDAIVKGPFGEKPNALLLARITWNGIRQLVWRVYDPEVSHESLSALIDSGDYPREFNYQMEYDLDWKYAQWFLDGEDADILYN
jgi:hypothetical protein